MTEAVAVMPEPQSYEEARAVCETWMRHVLTEAGVRRWFVTPHRRLAGLTPDQVLRDGQFPEVWKLILGYLDPTFS